MIELKKLSHAFLRKSLFEEASVRLLDNERYGVVGANGSGKSTLLRMIAGEMEADSGDIEITANLSLFRIGQDHSLNDNQTIIDTAMMGKRELFNAIKRQEAILKESDADHGAEIAHLEEFISTHEGYRLRPRSQEILEGLGLPTALHDEPLKVLSGGYKWRVFLAQALVKSPDILMLDEPTNHLDIVSIHWLEQFLSNYQGSIVLVSHDRRFMDNVCTRILDIDFSTITEYVGNYTAFEKARRLFLLQKEKEILAQQKEIAKKEAFIERFKAKASKARQAQSRIKQLEKIVIEEPIRSTRIHPHFRFEMLDRGSKDVLEVKNLSKSYGEKLIINNFSFSVQRGDKIAIIGPNGSGKSTLIKALAEEFSECRKSIKWGHGTSYGYFAQDCGVEIKQFKDSVLEWLWQCCADKPQSFVQGMLGRVLFSGDDAKKLTKDLSGGELSRLYLAYLMIKKPNVLLLDEPTNHLDLETIESLTSALGDFSGTLIVVSHDRTFIDNIAQRIIELESEGVKDYLGTYSEFVAFKERDYLDAKGEIASKKEGNTDTSQNRLSYDEQKRRRAEVQKLKKHLDKLMLAVEETEQKISELDKLFLEPNFFVENSHERVLQIENDKNQLKQKVSSMISDWERSEQELSRLDDGI
jgi:ATPase subunit of ABC transporter with duplicated ATPase domains